MIRAINDLLSWYTFLMMVTEAVIILAISDMRR